jgi:hypothetical protein
MSHVYIGVSESWEYKTTNIELIMLFYLIPRDHLITLYLHVFIDYLVLNKGNNKITELRTILQRESQNS